MFFDVLVVFLVEVVKWFYGILMQMLILNEILKMHAWLVIVCLSDLIEMLNYYSRVSGTFLILSCVKFFVLEVKINKFCVS